MLRDIKVRVYIYFELYLSLLYEIQYSLCGELMRELGNCMVRRKPRQCAGYVTNMVTWREIVC